MLARSYWQVINRLSKQLRSQPSEVSMKCGSPGSSGFGDNLGVHESKAEVGEASSAITMDEYIWLQSIPLSINLKLPNEVTLTPVKSPWIILLA